MFKMIGILFLALAAAAGDAHAAGLRGDAPENSRLLKLVVLSRHGVRSPTQSPEELARWASRPWPQWPGWLKLCLNKRRKTNKQIQKTLA